MASKQKSPLSNFIKFQIANNRSFACYRLPNEIDIQIIAQRNSKTYTLKKNGKDHKLKGFVFAPFKETAKQRSVLIKADLACSELNLKAEYPIINSLTQSSYHLENIISETSTKKQFIDLVNEIKKSIQSNSYKKIVAARALQVTKPNKFDPVTYFKLLCKKYSDAFVSLVYTPEHGIWLGASPEVLVTMNANNIITYSLAGTQPFKREKNTQWGTKEIEEQKIVSKYILDSFKKLTKLKPAINGPITTKAGNLLHLRTTFKYPAPAIKNWQKIVQVLHPTPAVAGLPKQKAVDFIIKHEVAPRNFYSGYLGPVNINKVTQLFVNIRCMQVFSEKLQLHVGCGITADSVAQKEWNETIIKSQTLLGLL